MRSISMFARRCFCISAALAVSAMVGCGSPDGTTPTASMNGATYNDVSGNSRPEKRQVDLHPVVQVRTSAGEFTLKLNAELAPLTVDNFLTYARAGLYNGTIFHQVYEGFTVLGGGYDAQFNPRPTQTPVRNEAHNKLKNRRGTIAMARQADAVDSATNQFFINLADNPTLDFSGSEPSQYGYCVFGEVISGMDVVDKIAKGEVRTSGQFENVPVQPVVIESIVTK